MKVAKPRPTPTRAGSRRPYPQACETLAWLAPMQPVTSLRESTRVHALRVARTCYDHLAGRLGVSAPASPADERREIRLARPV